MKTKTIYLFDEQGQFTNTYEIAEKAQHNPAVATDIAPPKHDSAADDCVYNGKQWVLDVGAKAKRAKDAAEKAAAENAEREVEAAKRQAKALADAEAAQDLADEKEALAEIIKEQFAKPLAERMAARKATRKAERKAAKGK